jgi:hypothetical protein
MGFAWLPDAPPYVRVQLVGGVAQVQGRSDVELGHRVDLGDGRLPGGNWAAWRWDGQALSVETDRYRGYPLYYAADDRACSVSPSIDALLALGAARELDLDAIAAFLSLGYFAGEDTAFSAIRAMPPAGRLTWRPGSIELTSDRARRPAPQGTREEALRTTAELVRTAVRRSIPAGGSYRLPISGGRDSRHLLLELLDAGHRPTAGVTAHHHPHVWGGDVPYAADLCGALGIPHEVVSPGPLVADEWRKNRMTSYQADEHAWYPAVADALNGHTDHTYDGLNGSTAFARDYYTPKMQRLSGAGQLADLARQLGRRHRGQPRYLPLLAPAMRGELGAERAAARIERELQRFADEGDPYLAFRFWSRTVNELNLPSTLMLSAIPAAYTPFMDPDVVEFSWTIPSRHIDDRFHQEVIDLRFPQHAHLPYRPKTRPQPSRPYLRQVNRDLAGLLRHRSNGSLVDRRALLRRTALGSITGDDWITWGRRSALTVWLIQLEGIVAGSGPGPGRT